MATSLQLPFKPYRTDEVLAITGCSFGVLDKWLEKILPLQVGEDANQTYGLDALQTFAVFVGWLFLQEGAPKGRAEEYVKAVQMWDFPMFLREFEQGNTFLVLNPHTMVPAPKNSLGQRLNLKRLMQEYIASVKRVFPEG